MRVVLHPPDLWIILGKLSLSDGYRSPPIIEKNGTGTGRSLIKSEDVLHRIGYGD